METEDVKNWNQCKTWRELELIQRERGYKLAWALHKARVLGIRVPDKYRDYSRHLIRR